MNNVLYVGKRVTLAHGTKSNLTYGYIRSIELDGTLTVYFPEIKSIGCGWKPYDFCEGTAAVMADKQEVR